MLIKWYLNSLCLLGMLMISSLSHAVAISKSKSEPEPKTQFQFRTLQSVIQHTLQYNPSVLRVLANKAAVHANYRGALSGFMPRAFIRYSTGKQKTENRFNLAEDITLRRTEQTLGLTIPIFSGFSTYNLIKQRSAEYRVAGFNEESIQERVVQRTVLAYLEVLRIGQIYNITQTNIRAHQKILAKVRLKYQGGAGRKTEVELAMARLAQRLVSFRAVIGAKERTDTNFKQLTGFYPVELMEPEFLTKLPSSLATAIALASKTNPRLLESKAAMEASASAVAASKGLLLPRVNLEITKNRTENADGIIRVNHDSKAMLVVNYNLFNGGADIAQIDNALARRRAASQAYIEGQRAINAEVANAWSALQTDRQQLKQRKKYANAIEKVLLGYEKQFSLGRRSLLNLLDIENERYNAKITLINEQYSVKYDSYRLIASIGTLVNYFNREGR